MPELLLLAIGAAGAFASGLLGIGGGIVLIPLALYLPPLFGLPAYSMSQVVAMSMVQVLAASSVGMVSHARRGAAPRALALPLGVAVGLGAIAGGLASGVVPEAAMKALFAAIALAAALLMGRPSPPSDEGEELPANFPMLPAAFLSLGVGFASGLLGIGGGALMIPMLTYLFRLPLRLVIGTSLAVVFVAGLMGTLGKALAHQIPWRESLFLVVGALGGAPLGVKLSHRLSVGWLRKLLAATLLVTAFNMVREIGF